MLKNFLTIGLRNMRNHRLYTLINILGLAIGISFCILIATYIGHELSYDQHHHDANRIYRVDLDIKFGSNQFQTVNSPAPMAEALRNDFPEVEASGRFWGRGSYLIKRTDQNIKETGVIYADSSIFNIFTIPFIEGNQKLALRDPFTMAISQSMALKYFPNEDALGQTLVVDNKDSYKIIGVFEDMPSTSHFHFEIILALVSDQYNKDQQWLNFNFVTYVKLRKAADFKALQSKFAKMVDKYAGPQARTLLGSDFTMENFRASGNKIDFSLKPLKEIHLHSDLSNELGINSDIKYIYLFAITAVFILIIACINFMNLSTARSANRAKEVGMRKVMGSSRGHLIQQFLGESLIMSAISFALGLIIAWSALPYFNDISNMQLVMPIRDLSFWTAIICSLIVVSTLAGTYPAFFLSAFKPISVLKGNLARGAKSGWVRSGLVIFQFCISIVLIIGTLAVNKQLGFIHTKRLGFNKDQVIVIKDAYALGQLIQPFKTAVLKDSRILNGTASGFLPVEGTSRSDGSYWLDGSQPTQDNMVHMQQWRVDHDYLETLGMKIKFGRKFSKEFPSDSSAVMLNEAAAKMFSFSKDSLGAKITTDGVNTPWRVIGIVEDFHFESLRQNVGPVALFLGRSTGCVSFRFESKQTQDVISSIEKTWKGLAPTMPFNYSFLDNDFEGMYRAEQRLGKVFDILAIIAIVIASLGLFALTAFTAEQRTKEIGIRKILGASLGGIVGLLSKEFGKLIVIAFFIATPIAWYSIQWWLRNYAYRADIGIDLFILAGVASFTIAWLTMSYQSIKAASADPVKSLRNE